MSYSMKPANRTGAQVITQKDELVLKLVPFSKSIARRKAGTAKGLISMSDAFDEPLEDFREYMQ